MNNPIPNYAMKQKTEQPQSVQLLARLTPCDSDHEDGLDFCVIKLDTERIDSILETHKQSREVFPEILEITLEDREEWAQFLTGDEAELLEAAIGKNTFYLIIDENKFIQIDESQNSPDAWNIAWRKIVICDEDVKFCAVYESNAFLNNAFTETPLIPLEVLKNTLWILKFQSRRKLDNGFVLYDEFGSFFKFKDDQTLLQAPKLISGEIDADEEGNVFFYEVVLDALIGEERAEYEAILQDLKFYAARQGDQN